MKLFLSIAVTAIWCMRPAVCPAQTSVSDRFYQAIRYDNAGDLKALIRSQDVNARDSRGATPLMYAAAFGNAKQMKLLLESGADVNAQNAFQATALIWAGGDAVKSQMLIEHGAGVNVHTQQGRTPLMAAAKRNGNADLVRLLLEKGADVRTPGDTTLIQAAQSGDLEIMRLLIESGANVNCISPRLGETPLMYAAASDNVEAVRLLLAKGANPNAGLKKMTRVIGGSTVDMGVGKQTPLMWAAPTGSPELIRALIDGRKRECTGYSRDFASNARGRIGGPGSRCCEDSSAIGRERQRAQRERRDGARLGQEIRQPSGDRRARKGWRAGRRTLSSSCRA
jgi:ankyrin repeat protein